MVQLILGNKGKGKTKHLLDKVNAHIKEASGNIVYLDKSTKHMYELNNKVRLIDTSEYLISNYDQFLGFLCGIISQDHDLEAMYLDSFLDIACLAPTDTAAVIEKIETISDNFKVDFTISISLDESELPASLKENIIISL
ncbi:MAG: twitching motility protein PilT [Lachnospiraceae bacterium]|jgi:ABC-type cobalamin/Fe3+-siderophores transport system ATPase subunit|nr:twitching motility protein PilT [Lachnospiraceae bacterium]